MSKISNKGIALRTVGALATITFCANAIVGDSLTFKEEYQALSDCAIVNEVLTPNNSNVYLTEAKSLGLALELPAEEALNLDYTIALASEFSGSLSKEAHEELTKARHQCEILRMKNNFFILENS